MLNAWKTRAEASTLAEIEGQVGAGRSREDSAELALSYRELRISSERHDYRLDVTLTNLGSESIVKYHIDLEMPARIAEQRRRSVLYVPERSSSDIAFSECRIAIIVNRFIPVTRSWSERSSTLSIATCSGIVAISSSEASVRRCIDLGFSRSPSRSLLAMCRSSDAG